MIQTSCWWIARVWCRTKTALNHEWSSIAPGRSEWFTCCQGCTWLVHPGSIAKLGRGSARSHYLSYMIIRLNHVMRGKSRDAWHASSECVLLETFSQRRIQHLPTLLLLLLPMLMLPCSLYQPAALAAATPAGVGYDVEADGRRVAKMSAVFRLV